VKNLKNALPAALLATVLVTTAGTASAKYRNRYGDEVGSATLSAQFDYGFWTGDGDVNAFGPGLGLRGGYTLPVGIYLGGDFDYFFGESRSAGVSGIAGASGRVNVYDFMAEVGYDFWVHDAGVLRPKLGLGVGIGKVNACVNAVNLINVCGGDSSSGFALGIGLQYLHFFDNIFLGLEGRYETVSIDGPDPSAIILGIGVGVAL
jgi:hypothetical protein